MRRPLSLKGAIDELYRASRGRPFVLVVETHHGSLETTDVKVHIGQNQTCWQTVGLLEFGRTRVDRKQKESLDRDDGIDPGC